MDDILYSPSNWTLWLFFPILYDYKQQSGNIFVHKCLGMY